MIPKIIHYCWFGKGVLPPLAQKCIKSWKKNLPDYKIIEWNEDNFNVNICKYTKEAYKEKKYAFVSDYARFWILYHYGGIYFDTDVEVIKPLDPIITKGAFMGCEIGEEKDLWPKVASGLGLGVCKGHPIYKEILDQYNTSSFIQDGSIDYTTVVYRVTEILKKHQLKQTKKIQTCEGITIYPPEFFCPKSHLTRTLNITSNTYTIHHYDGSWLPKNKLIGFLESFLSYQIIEYIRETSRNLRKKIKI
jgi:mannosyltransferase OCH1-like enzyme